MSAVELDRVTRRYEGADASARPALSELSLAITEGEIVVVVGPSGCGKSTTLRLVAGLDEPDGGEVRLHGRSMRGVPPQERDVAMVFQGYALYPHMSAREILEFPLKMRKIPAAERAKKVDEAAEMLGLGQLLDRRPEEMSGGERQRVAMGRAIVRRPRVFLFDEPLSNLDASLRAGIRAEIGDLVRRLGATAMYVTHDHVEAMTLGDRIAVLQAGRLETLATPRDLYERPENAFVASFVGTPKMNLVDGEIEGSAFVAGELRLDLGERAAKLPKQVTIGVRPEHVLLDADGPIRGVVSVVEPLGAETHLTVRVGTIDVRLRAPGFDVPKRGENAALRFDRRELHAFDRSPAAARVSF